MLNKTFHTLLIIASVLLPTLCVKCSSPVSGVETGNPAMTACAKAALNLLSNNTVWQPESYLISGKNQLDPNSIISSNQTQSLSKRTAQTDSTSLDGAKPTIITRVDTIINVSRVYVNDTITRTYNKADTSVFLDRSNSTSDSATVITEKTVSELLFIVDTVTIYDTFTVTHYDTIIKWGEAAKPDLPTIGNKTTISQPTPTVTAESDDMNVYLKVVSESKRYSIPADYTSSTSEMYSRISRSGSIAAMSIFEEYSDADGDGNLLFSASNGIPIVNLNASYSLSNKKQLLLVQFDPGTDRSFSHAADNKIHSLHKVMKSSDIINEDITYVKTESVSDKDNFSLSIFKSAQNDSISSVTTTFSLVASDPVSGTNYDSGRLCKAQYTAQYRNCSAESVNLTIIPDILLDAASPPLKASLKAFVDYGKGSTGIFEGVIDYTNKSVSGIYSENGTEFEFSYDDSTGESDFEIKK
jgi:hypothetical protein